MIERLTEEIKFRAGRIMLAGAMLGGTVVGCASFEPEECPATPQEVSHLTGGNPKNWQPIADMKGAWEFKSDSPEILNAPRRGRLDDKIVGQIIYGIKPPIKSTSAWYICLDKKTA